MGEPLLGGQEREGWSVEMGEPYLVGQSVFCGRAVCRGQERF